MIRGARAAKRAPSWQDIHVVYPPTAVRGAFRMHGAHILPKPAHFGCMACESCQELAIFPPEATFGMHGAQNLPRIAVRERTAAESCHGKTPENAQFRHASIASCPVAQRSLREGVGSVPWLCCGVRRATLSVQGSGHSAFSGLNCWERLRVCAVSVGNHEPASRSAKLCRIMC